MWLHGLNSADHGNSRTKFGYVMRRIPPARTLISAMLTTALVAAMAAVPAAAGPIQQTPLAATHSPVVVTTPAGVLSNVAKGLRGFDSAGAETPAQINCLSAAGYSFDIIDAVGTAWRGEYNAAAAAGMKVLLFQGYDTSTWADPTNGTRRGTIIASNAVAASYPAKAQIFLNLEDNSQPGTSVSEMQQWIANWAKAVRQQGYTPGIYVGVPQLLSTAELDRISDVVFWHGASRSAPSVGRGYVASQTSIGSGACGIEGGIDLDTAATDGRYAALVGAAFPKALPIPTTAGAFAPLSQSRIVDTRNDTGLAGPLARGATSDVQVAGRGGVPLSGAGAVVVNITVTAPTAAGYLSTFPTGAARPEVSSLNFVGRQTVANLVTVQLGAGGKVSLFNGSAGTVQVLVDVAGYYRSGTGTEPGTFTPVVPARLLDSRPAGVAPLSRTTVDTANRSPIPTGRYDAAVLNVTAVTPAARGFLTVYPANLTNPPTASNLNFPAGRTVPNMVTSPVDSSGKVLIYNASQGQTNLLADVTGYYHSGTRIDRGAFTPVTPTRLLDTRPTGKVPGGSAVALRIDNGSPVPANSSAVVLNVTVVHALGPGFLTVFPSDRSTPQASNINFVTGIDIANQIVVPIGADGRVVLLNSSAGATDLLADVAGYIRG